MRDKRSVYYNIDYKAGREMLLAAVSPVEMERVSLDRCAGRILAKDLQALENVPAFDRSPYDGYAMRSTDTLKASEDSPVLLREIEDVPAGSVPEAAVKEGVAIKVATGAPMPQGADTVVKFELIRRCGNSISVYHPMAIGENVIKAGEDIRSGRTLLRSGEAVDPGAAGVLASQGIIRPFVYRRLRVGLFSIGNELVDAEGTVIPGKIRDSNRHMLEVALKSMGCECVYLGVAGDSIDDIIRLFKAGLAECDAVISTGGVSVGDYDLTPEAMERTGIEMLFRGAKIKPGMSCAYGLYNGKPVCCLSGNPASALTNFYAITLPAIRKMMGCREVVSPEISITLCDGFRKKSPTTRLLRGKLELIDGMACMKLSADQGNVILSSAIGCNVMAIIPAGSGPVKPGSRVGAFLL